MKGILGVDLSEYQRGIDFDRLVQEGAEFVILRGGDGSYSDQCFGEFYDQAKARNLPVGAYWFSRAVTEAQAEEEAMRFYKTCLRGRQFELPVYMDVEAKAQQNLSRDSLTRIIQVWCDTLRKIGFYTGLYTSTSWIAGEVFFDRLEGIELWIAQWSTSEPKMDFGVWQFGGEVNYLRNRYMAGMIVDQNEMRKDYPTLIKALGLNGYRKGEIDMTREEVIALIDERINVILEGKNSVASQWAKEELAEAVEAGITDGTRPQGYARREEVAVMALRAVNNLY